MSGTRALAIVAVIWLVIGVVVAFVMRRRGHDFWAWFALGAVLGPLAVPLAIERARYHPATTRLPTVEAPGRFDVLAGIDGSAESIAAVKTAVTLFGESITSLTLASVLDYDSSSSYTGAELQEDAEKNLAQAAIEVGFGPASTTILFGRADAALIEYAEEGGFELIVVGARGHGISEALFGSVTARLVGRSAIPVYVGPGADVAAEVKG